MDDVLGVIFKHGSFDALDMSSAWVTVLWTCEE